MAELNSFRAIIELWPTRESLAEALRGATGTQVSKWWQRDSIPAEWWASLLATDMARGNGVTSDLLTRLAAHEPAEVRA